MQNPVFTLKRADALLMLIDERTLPDGRYWVPSDRHEYLNRFKETLFIYGSGDARALDSLVKKELIKKRAAGYAITEDGRIRVEHLMDSLRADGSIADNALYPPRAAREEQL